MSSITQFKELMSISPIDGRYGNLMCSMQEIFSEYALIKLRLEIEVDYFLFLTEIIPELSSISNEKKVLVNGLKQFTLLNAEEIKNIERRLNHDVKAVEVYLRNKFKEFGLEEYCNFIHFGLTSQDVNSLAYVTQLWYFKQKIYSPLINSVMETLKGMGEKYANIPMLSRTHGQPATPTILGKELMVFWYRLKTQYTSLRKYNYKTKFGGAVGNLNAHYLAYPEIDWNKQLADFVNIFAYNRGFAMQRNIYTTQIDNYDNYAEFFDVIRRVNTVLIDSCQDFWLYISRDYFKIKVVEGEVGSSAMPHKVNPICFENAEGNLGVSNALLDFLSSKLPVSRLQRDLTDSTVIRNVGVAFSHTILALKNIERGLHQLEVNELAINSDLERNHVVVSEAIQTLLRKENLPEAYDMVKDFTRTGMSITKSDMVEFIDSLDINKKLKDQLKKITPKSYAKSKSY